MRVQLGNRQVDHGAQIARSGAILHQHRATAAATSIGDDFYVADPEGLSRP
jgi:hypothetical protein